MERFDLLGELHTLGAAQASHLSPPPLALLRTYRDLDVVLGTLGEEGSQNKVILTLLAISLGLEEGEVYSSPL